jgi:PKD repeat protein
LVNTDENIKFGGVIEYTGGENTFAVDGSGMGSNIVGGPEVGGNYYDTPGSTGFSKTCADSDRDGYCDSNRELGGSDNPAVDTSPLAAACGATPIVGNNAPTDPDRRGDYQCEDVNGDGKTGVVDVQALFANLDSVAERSDSEAFNFNGQNGVDVVDVQRLFAELTR